MNNTISNIIQLGLSVISIYGAILNARKMIAGFYVWIIANCCWIIFNLLTKMYGQIPLWVIYTTISVIGVFEWKRQEKRNNK